MSDLEKNPRVTGSDAGKGIPPMVLVPGFWLGSWCYADVVMALAEHGRPAVAVDLAGHGLQARRPAAAYARPFDPQALATEPSPVADIDLADAAALLTRQVETIGGGRPVVIVAHSLAGPVLSKVLQDAPHLVEHAVYLAAHMPTSGSPAAAYFDAPENEGQQVVPAIVADPAVVGAVRLDVTSPDPAYRELLRRGLFADADPHVAAAALALLSSDGPGNIATNSVELTGDTWASRPRTYITCQQDRIVRPALQRRYIDEANKRFPDHPVQEKSLDSSHCPFLSMPAELAQVLATCA